MLKHAATKRVAVGDGYLQLVSEFPLRRIRTHKEHADAVGYLAELGIRGETRAGAEDYVETLAQLIEDYEKDAGLKMDLSHLTPARPACVGSSNIMMLAGVQDAVVVAGYQRLAGLDGDEVVVPRAFKQLVKQLPLALALLE